MLCRNSKMDLSTLLPSKDFHPDTIQKMNISISRDCKLWLNGHIAYYLSLTVHDLYVYICLLKKAAPVFAETLKDTEQAHAQTQEEQNKKLKANNNREAHFRNYQHHAKESLQTQAQAVLSAPTTTAQTSGKHQSYF